MQISTMIASLCGMENVSVVSKATPMVAVRPGSAPMTMPRNVAQITLKSVCGFMKPTKAAPSRPRLSNITQPFFQGSRT